MRLPTAKGPLRLYSRSVALGLRCSSVGAFMCRPACESGSSRGGGGHPSGDVQAGFCLVSSGPHPACPSDTTFSTWSCRSPGMWLHVGASPPVLCVLRDLMRAALAGPGCWRRSG